MFFLQLCSIVFFNSFVWGKPTAETQYNFSAAVSGNNFSNVVNNNNEGGGGKASSSALMTTERPKESQESLKI